MQSIKVDCPNCNMDYSVTYCTGWQQHGCLNCSETFVVQIDDSGRIFVSLRQQPAGRRPGPSKHKKFADQVQQLLSGQGWTTVQRKPREFSGVCSKGMNFGLGSVTYFIATANGDKECVDRRSVRGLLDKYFDFISRFGRGPGFHDSFCGLLILTFADAYETEIDDVSLELEYNESRVETCIGVFDFYTGRYTASQTKGGKQFNPFLGPVIFKLRL